MKTLVIYANCQGDIGLKYFLTQWTDYEVHSVKNYDTEELPYNIFRTCDVFVYQPLHPRHGVRSTDHILGLLRPDCVAISFPYVYSVCFFTINMFDIERETTDMDQSGMKNITNSYKKPDYFHGRLDFDFQHRYDSFVAKMRERESRTDVKLIDYIIANYRTKPLFMSSNHLTSYLFIEMTRQILERLELSMPTGQIRVGLNECGLEEFFGACAFGRYNYDFYKFDFRNDDPYVFITDFEAYLPKYEADDMNVIHFIDLWLSKFQPITADDVQLSHANFGLPVTH
jgi:hypothetical protein